MRILFAKITLFVFLTLSANTLFAQLASCNTSQNACSNPGFSLTSNAGTGLPAGLNVSNPQTNPAGGNYSGCLLSNGPGPNWMIITIANNGLLGFSFGANGSLFPQSGFYDWAMWAYTPTTCNDIFNNVLPPVACCWNQSATGGTGMGAAPAGGIAGNYVPSLAVIAGQQFLILLSNYSGVTTSVSINNTGTAGTTCSPLLIPSAIRCPGQQAALTATWAANVSNITYTITTALPLAPNSFTVQTNPTFVVSPSATQVYTVLATGSNSMSAVVTSSNTFTVTISPTTTIDVSAPNNNGITLGEGSICYNATPLFTAALGGSSYTLTGNSTPTVISYIPVISGFPLTANGSYTISTTLFSGCTATANVNVHVAPNNPLVVTPLINACLGSTPALTSTLTSSDSTYIWSGPNIQNPISVRTTSMNINAISLTGAGVYSVSSNILYGGNSVGTNTILCPVSATSQLNVVATSPINISALPTHTPCQGSSVYLSAGITGTAGFIWAGPNNYNASAQTNTVASLLPVNAGVYTATAIFTNGYLSCMTTSTVNINVVATAIPTINLIPNNICQNDTAYLSVTSAITPTAYLWSGPNSFSPSVSAPIIPSIQPVASGVYFVRAFYPFNCFTQTSGQINVVQVNTITVIPPSPVCTPDNVNLNASAINAISYTWHGPNNFVIQQQNPVVYQPSVSASGIYSVTVAFGGGVLVCYNTATVAVTVNPNLNFSIVPWQQVCYNTPVQISGPPGGTSYAWTSSSGFTSSLQDLVLPAASVADAGSYSLSVSLGPCVTTQSSLLEVIDRIQPLYNQQSTTICKGDTITLKSEVQGGNGTYYAYTWQPSIYLNSPTGSIQSSVRPLGTTIYNVTTFDTRCPEYKLSNTFEVTVLNAAKPDLQLETSYGCQPLCLFYDAKINSSKTIVTYDFLGDNGTRKRFQADGGFNYCLNDAGNYTLRILTTTLDDATNLFCSDSLDYPAPLIVIAKPGSDISLTPEAPTMSENTVTFFANSKNGVAEKWQWDFGGAANDTISSPEAQRIFDYTGHYSVKLITTNDLGCTDTISKYFDVKDDFAVYVPNTFTPNGDNLNDVFMMKGSGIMAESFLMEIFDRWGSLVFSTADSSKGWDGTVKGQQKAGEGVYIYKIKLNGSNGEGKKEYVGQITLAR